VHTRSAAKNAVIISSTVEQQSDWHCPNNHTW